MRTNISSGMKLSTLSVFMILATSGCADSDVQLVKSSYLHGYESHTIGQAFGSRSECSTVKWRSYQDDRGRTLVDAVCRLSRFDEAKEWAKRYTADGVEEHYALAMRRAQGTISANIDFLDPHNDDPYTEFERVNATNEVVMRKEAEIAENEQLLRDLDQELEWQRATNIPEILKKIDRFNYAETWFSFHVGANDAVTVVGQGGELGVRGEEPRRGSRGAPSRLALDAVYADRSESLEHLINAIDVLTNGGWSQSWRPISD